MGVWKIIFLSKWVICRFHVSLQKECLGRGPPCPYQPVTMDRINYLKIARYQETLGDTGFQPNFLGLFPTDDKANPVGVSKITLPETNSSPLEIDGWNTIVSFWEGPF